MNELQIDHTGKIFGSRGPISEQALAFLLVATLAVGVGCQDTPTPAADDGDRPVPVRVVPVSVGHMRETVRYVGTVEPVSRVTLRARIPGVLEDQPVEPGDRVSQGDVIARLVAPEMKAKTDQIRAEIRRARAEREHRCEIYETDQKLLRSGALEQARVDVSRKACVAAREGVTAARAQLSEVRHTRSKTVEKSPHDAVILSWMAEPGEYLGPGQSIVILGVGGVEVVTNVVEHDMRRGIGEGTPVTLAFSEGSTFESTVGEVSPMARGPARAFRVEADVPTDASPSPVGSSVDVGFVVAQAAGVSRVPVRALHREGGETLVFVVEGGRASPRIVEPGISADGEVAISPSLEAGAEVAVSNLDVLEDGTSVFAVRGGER